jgi:uncharacterized protein
MEEINEQLYSFGTPKNQWEEGVSKSITFIVTEDCQLRCKYCYIVGKNSFKKLNFEIAKENIDYLMSHPEYFPERSVIWDFIGGEPLLEIELIDRICDYIKVKTYEMDHKWFNNYRFSFTSNGILYDHLNVQKYIEKNISHISMTITLDGTKSKHDLNRIYKNGKGSYDDTIKNIPLWLKQFPGTSTKVTVSSEDLKYLKESILHLWKLGIKNIDANVVSENVWKEGDDLILEDQLVALADEVIAKEYYKDYNCSFFSESIGKPNTNNSNWCGAGKMLAIDTQGQFYPCLRFAQFSLENKPEICIGNAKEGIDFNKLRPFLSLDLVSQSTYECLTCGVATGCAWCQGTNYDCADTNTIFQRATFICKMHKARVRANNYYWNKLRNKQSLK